MADDRVKILNDLKSALTSIRRENGFRSTCDRIERGIWLPEDISERPAITLYNTDSKIIETTTTFEVSGLRELNIIITGFTLWGKENPNDLDALASDIEDFFNSKTYNPYFSWTQLGDWMFYEGPSVDPIGICQLIVKVKYAFNDP